jgi:methyltransferase (TIGR00027 family)
MVLAAVEQHEPPQRRLVHDDLAGRFLPLRLRALVAATRVAPVRRAMLAVTEWAGPGLWASIACRKRLIDDVLTAALPGIDALVILGAGLDTRAYRLTGPGIPVFEVDQPVNVALKDAVIRRVAPAQRRVTLVPLDFERDDLMTALAGHGFDRGRRTFFVWEGVTQYLEPAAVRSTLAQLRVAAPGSILAFTYVRQDFIDGTCDYGAPMVYRRFRDRSRLWKSGMDPAGVGAVLAEFGWRLSRNVGPEFYLDNYIRPSGRRLTASEIEWTAVAEKV